MSPVDKAILNGRRLFPVSHGRRCFEGKQNVSQTNLNTMNARESLAYYGFGFKVVRFYGNAA